jgi:thioredoxin 1
LTLVTSPHIVHITDATFAQDVLQSDKPVLLDFWAEWCGPCRAIAPILEDLAGEYQDRLKIAKLNTDQNPHTAQTYSVRSIPTLILFRDGKVAEQKVGLASKAQLVAFLEKHIPATTSKRQSQ